MKTRGKTLFTIVIALLVFNMLAPYHMVGWLSAKDLTQAADHIQQFSKATNLWQLADRQKNLVAMIDTSQTIAKVEATKDSHTLKQAEHDPLLDDFYTPPLNVVISNIPQKTYIPSDKETTSRNEENAGTAKPLDPKPTGGTVAAYTTGSRTSSEEVSPKSTQPEAVSNTDQDKTTVEKTAEDATAKNYPDTPYDFSKALEIPAGEKAVVMLAGDSLMIEGMGAVIVRYLLNHGQVDVRREAVYSTGLCRDDYFDWPAHMETIIEKNSPDLVLIHIGANDGQDIVEIVDEKKKRRIAGTDAWKEAYGKRAADLLEKATADGAKVIWIGLPVMGQKPMSTYITGVSAEQEKACKDNPNCLYIDTFQSLADSEGNFQTFWEEEDKTKVRIRSKDKIHVTEAGGKIMLKEISPALDKLLPPVQSQAEQPETTGTAAKSEHNQNNGIKSETLDSSDSQIQNNAEQTASAKKAE